MVGGGGIEQVIILLGDAQRIALIDMVLDMLRASGDGRAAEAIAEYERQRAEVAARMTAPPGVAQVIGMQTVCMQGTAPS
jgi:ABC-type Fe2+-enterobactin transport system substrate-binding protein